MCQHDGTPQPCGRREAEVSERWDHRPAPAFDQLESKTVMFETGIKVIDLLTHTCWWQDGLFGCAVSARRCSSGMIGASPRITVGIGVRRCRERTREGNDLIVEMDEAGCWSDALVFADG